MTATYDPGSSQQDAAMRLGLARTQFFETCSQLMDELVSFLRIMRNSLCTFVGICIHLYLFAKHDITTSSLQHACWCKLTVQVQLKHTLTLLPQDTEQPLQQEQGRGVKAEPIAATTVKAASSPEGMEIDRPQQSETTANFTASVMQLHARFQSQLQSPST